MYELGHTRSVRRSDHLLLTPDTFVRAPLPGMTKAMAIVHVGPAIGAGFTQYTVEFEDGGIMGTAATQRFIYVLEGEVRLDERTVLRSGDFEYAATGRAASVASRGRSRVAVIEKPYQSLAGKDAPASFTGTERSIKAEPLEGDNAIEVRHLLPDDFAFDFAVNTMTYQPGAALPMVESHVMEHGLLMLAGGGIYRLSDAWYPVKAGDFIWMAPYCPQWFGALGKEPARYLIYKDWNRFLP
jgi:(S)-ureidoglycine aminohydrolase